MAKPSVYLEPTVISYYTASRTRDLIMAAHQEITWEWWEGVLPRFDPYISQIVFDEISRGDADAAERRLAAVREFKVLETIMGWTTWSVGTARTFPPVESGIS
jgi:hypothetical protein